MKKRIALIDADCLAYYSSKETIEESIIILKERIRFILESIDCTDSILFLTGERCFRYDIYPLYKANRGKYPQPLKYLKTLKSLMIEEYKGLIVNSLEADDLVAYYQWCFQQENSEYEPVVCSTDKDVIYQLIGKHWNFKYNSLNGNVAIVEKGHWVETNAEQSREFIALQMLMGDSSDNIPGLVDKTDYMKQRFDLDNRKGICEVTAKKIISIIKDKYEGNYEKEVLKCYVNKYGGETEYNLNKELILLFHNYLHIYL